KAVKGRSYNIVRVIGSEDLGPNIVNAKRLQNSSHSTARDNARTLGRGFQQHAARTVFTDQFVRQSALDQWNADQIILCGLDRLLDCVGYFFCLSGSKSNMSGLVAYHDQRRERQILTALYNLGNTIDRYQLVLQDQSRRRNSLFMLLHIKL